MSDKMNVDALFLGPKSENQVFFKEMMDYAISEHMHWRSDFHPEDAPLMTPVTQHQPDFRDTLYRTEGILQDLSARLKTKSVPWFSPRYLGHMNADTLMVSNLAYVMTMLYNPNNCAHEASPVTTELELAAGHDLCRMFGYDVNKSWAHITSGGTVANYEGVWVARNLKTMPLAIAACDKSKDLVEGMTEHQLLNMKSKDILDLTDELKKRGIFEEVRALTARGVGVDAGKLGKFLVPRSKHYSWMKAMDVLGLGQEHIIPLEVDGNYRTDVEKMREVTFKLMEEGTPILGMVSVVGTTEEGSIDPVHEVMKLRQECEEKYGSSFYVHVDAAYGGYVRSMFLDDDNQFMEYDALIERYRNDEIIPEGVVWPKRDVYDAFAAMSEADSITVDPHKVGFIQYAAGAVAMKDKRIVDLISYHAAYVFEEADDDNDEDKQVVLGSSIMEGSKAGATAAAVWAAHRLVPLNVSGYGHVIGRGIVTADWFAKKLATAEPFVVDGRRFEVRPLMHPDFHMVDFTFKEIGNDSLEAHNKLNQRIYELCSYATGRTYTKDFLTSSTSLSEEEYGQTPRLYAESRGFSDNEWNTVGSVYILRSAVMTHFLRDEIRFNNYWNNLRDVFTSLLSEIIDEENKQKLAHTAA
ncbi:decarboxylase [Photobacterium kishitanii]|uniref:Tyrosine decarboxylase n=1 Tax=Photobacterium kishitanii TaxID=318456 RepID=A0AAX0YYG0_9GAMM|nr:pyridoxal-dependent decarboxylase [Photobacterium kishitanii]KJG09489.1 decarboxylase [Photobacterium kishitanii]KJG57271.1 decarboxylase [Photobacterium kishitanii]KJG60687.1 decarboxylase [Photobacterium kishitanii]KJG64980.1 decarboxylase [Photobacterium kishitanii]KJG69060.1 decarboxylase [Photobacterium kishitanii]